MAGDQRAVLPDRAGARCGSFGHLAALQSPLHAQCLGPRRKELTACRLRLHRHCLCSGHPGSGKHPVAQCRRPDQAKGAETRQSHGQRRAGRARFPRQHWAKLHSTNPIERLNGEIKRRTEVVGIFSDDDAIVRLVGALFLEQNDEWAVQRSRYMTLETIATMSDDPLISLPAAAS